MEATLTRLARLLNPTRMRYPYLIGAALWAGWVISLLAGPGNTDAAGHLIGTDFVAFYTAGKILLQQRSMDLYNLELAHQIQQPLYSQPSENFNPYLNPPFYAWLFIPFALLPYPFSPLLWMSINLLMAWGSLYLLIQRKRSLLYVLILTWMPAFTAISFGQNAFMSLLILSSTYILWRRSKYLAAGMVSGLLLYKPQLLLGIGLLWLLDYRRNWHALFGLGFSGLVLLSLSYLLMPEATIEYYFFTLKIASNLMNVEGFPIWNAHGLQSFWLGIFPKHAAVARYLYLVFALGGAWFFVRFWRSINNPALRFGGAICLTVWITPYIMIYDWVLLIIPAILFWQENHQLQVSLKVIYAFLWVVMFFSSVLTYGQWSLMGWAVQISIPALLVAFLLANKLILTHQKVVDPVTAG
jgi:alpha-1,2-mannosyltransferase